MLLLLLLLLLLLQVLARVLPQESVSRLFALAFHSMADIFAAKLQQLQQQQQQGSATAAASSSLQVQRLVSTDASPAAGLAAEPTAAAAAAAAAAAPQVAGKPVASTPAIAAAAAAAAGEQQWSVGDRLCLDCLCLYESLRGFPLLLQPLSLLVCDLFSACSKVYTPSPNVQQLLEAALPL